MPYRPMDRSWSTSPPGTRLTSSWTGSRPISDEQAAVAAARPCPAGGPPRGGPGDPYFRGGVDDDPDRGRRWEARALAARPARAATRPRRRRGRLVAAATRHPPSGTGARRQLRRDDELLPAALGRAALRLVGGRRRRRGGGGPPRGGAVPGGGPGPPPPPRGEVGVPPGVRRRAGAPRGAGRGLDGLGEHGAILGVCAVRGLGFGVAV